MRRHITTAPALNVLKVTVDVHLVTEPSSSPLATSPVVIFRIRTFQPLTYNPLKLTGGEVTPVASPPAVDSERTVIYCKLLFTLPSFVNSNLQRSEEHTSELQS